MADRLFHKAVRQTRQLSGILIIDALCIEKARQFVQANGPVCRVSIVGIKLQVLCIKYGI